ncbi:MAG: non-canonical purine NTP pyrophosphatase [Acidobacteriota bacterium]|nr:non-canonical purine NTP pyrophosphatase [Acidobacteriota bacterium]
MSSFQDTLEGAILVTGNSDKILEARRILGFELAVAVPGSAEFPDLPDLPEIQSLDVEAVLAAKAEAAWGALERPLIVEDTGLELEALNGFPGPLVKWLLDAVGPPGIARLGLSFGNPRAAAVCALVYRNANTTISAIGRTEGQLVLPPRGNKGFGWDPVFQPDGETSTYGDLSAEAKDSIGHRGRAWRALAEKLGEMR